jgi:2',3'-cyclic-nucleotide 2'-phosphodiesterase (5'-nucleotidase family)
MNEVVARTAKDIKRGLPEGPLNNLVTDGIATVAGELQISFDFVHINYKTLRATLPEGNIPAYKIFEMLPYENNLVTVKLQGADVFQLFQYMASRNGDPISRARFEIKDGKAINIKIKGEPLNMSYTYTVLTNDYLANGGDEAAVYQKAIARKDYPVKLRNAFFKYLEQYGRHGNLNPERDGRVVSE